LLDELFEPDDFRDDFGSGAQVGIWKSSMAAPPPGISVTSILRLRFTPKRKK
jgi:hypothetical protein